jgi:ComF family protein
MIPPVLKDIFHGLIGLLYPPHCSLCGKHLGGETPSGILCPECRDSIVWNAPPFCPQCSRHLGKYPEHPRCRQCRRHRPAFDFAWSACVYDDPLKELIHRFKYGQKTRLRRLFTEMINSFVRRHHLDAAQFDMAVPVPLSAARLRERGYNQAQVLAEGICREFQIACSVNNLIRARHTQPQSLLDEKQRWTNIQGAFTIKHSEKFADKNILIIDDLLTTGATVSEIARTLKKAGAQTVGVLTLAIAV